MHTSEGTEDEKSVILSPLFWYKKVDEMKGRGGSLKQVVIENPVINSPFEVPARHFRFSEDGITNEIISGRRPSSYFIPIASPRKKKTGQLSFDTQWTQDRIEENKFINQIRAKVREWRGGRYTRDVTKTTARLLEHWTRPDRDPSKRFFYCQIEAVQTAIYLTEVAGRSGDRWVENHLREKNEAHNPGLYRIAFKMATGSGKTVVMAMLIAWHALNKLADAQDARFGDAFLIVSPGITIKDRLRVLLPTDPQNYYDRWDILPLTLKEEIRKAKVVVTNFHALKPRERSNGSGVSKYHKEILGGNPFQESPGAMVRRVCRELGSKKNIVVINDEAHHCYRGKPPENGERLVGDDRKEAERREEAARVWISGLEAVKDKVGIRAMYDLSATPFFLRGSGYDEGTLFPWVVSDFSLIDAIESGIVKVPRVPVADDTMKGDLPTYRDIWHRIREHLPKKGRGKEALSGEPKLPVELEGALQSLYGNYEKYYRQWKKSFEECKDDKIRERMTPPVFIVVCNNTNVSKLVFDYIAGWEKELKDGSTIAASGKLALFRNEEAGKWSSRPNTILVDSEQLESGEVMSKEFKKIAAREIEEFKAEYRERFPGRDAEDLADEDLLREVMNTVGKSGKLGERIKCVVSVSMLTEGWDANTVTHILGVRAFGTQLLCEQVVGRGLRRMGYGTETRMVECEGKTVEIEAFPVEYAEVYGVPFSFIPTAGTSTTPKPSVPPTRVKALEERIACEITFPRLMGYRYEVPAEKLVVNFASDSKLALSSESIPMKVESAPIIGETAIHTLDDLKRLRDQEVVFFLAKRTLETYFRDDDQNLKFWFFPQLVEITRRWFDECVICKGNTFKQLLYLAENANDAGARIFHSIVASTPGEKVLKPILRPYDTVGSTRYVDFDTTRPVYRTKADRCHVSHVVADTESWEQKMAQVLEDMGEVAAYVKNQNLGFTIPYVLNGEEKNYIPDFIAKVRDGQSDLLNLIVEVSGEKKKDKAAKVATARNLWVPAVNNHGGYGRWAFLEISDPWDAERTMQAFIANGCKETA